MSAVFCVLCLLMPSEGTVADPVDKPAGETEDQVETVIHEVEKACLERSICMIGRKKAERLAELVRQAKPKVAVECGTAIGYSGLWIARELEAAGNDQASVGARLITIEINPKRAHEAEANFRKAGLEKYVTVKVGDARKVVKELQGPIDFLFVDCGYSNYYPILVELEKKLSDGAVVVADNVGIGANAMADYLKHVRSKYKSRTEWFDVNLPWAKRDAVEVTVISR